MTIAEFLIKGGFMIKILVLIISILGYVDFYILSNNNNNNPNYVNTTNSSYDYSHQVLKENSELECMAKNLYYEARNQSEEGIQKVGFTVMNRVNSGGRWPSTICGVVYQKHQFSWTDESNLPNIDKKVYCRMVAIANKVMTSNYNFKANHYHTLQVSPRWDRKMIKVNTVGNHVFFKGE
jgi:spore germination cell wall hydrolase CwlJ-like protein